MADLTRASHDELAPVWTHDGRPETDQTSRRFHVVWQAADRSFHTVGTLEVDQDAEGTVLSSRFWYEPHVATVPGFQPFAEFPSFPPTALVAGGIDDRWQWESRDGLLAMFRNRVLSPRRPDFVPYATALGLGEDADPVELLARSGGRRATDTIHIVAEPIQREDGSRDMLFLVSGVRHIDPDGKGASSVRPGDELAIRTEPENEYDSRALLLDNVTGEPLGYVPNYLLDDVHKHIEEGGSVAVHAEHVNGPDTPAHLRLLARLRFVSRSVSQGTRTVAPPSTEGADMADKRPVHTVPTSEGWANKREGAARASKTFATKSEAEAAGRATAKRERTEHVSHRRDGTIGDKRSYGNDPFPPRDKR